MADLIKASDTLNEGRNKINAIAKEMNNKEVASMPEVIEAREGKSSLANNLRNKLNKGGVSVFDIDKNKGKFDQTYMADSFLQTIAGDAPVNAIPEDKSITTEKIADNAISFRLLDDNFLETFGINVDNLFLETRTGSYDSVDGHYIGDPARTSTGFIPIDPSKKVFSNLLYTLSSAQGNQLFLFFDEDKVFLEAIRSYDYGVTPPANTKFVLQNLSVDGRFYTDLENYKIWQGYKSSKIDKNSFHRKHIEHLLKLRQKNLFKPDEVKLGSMDSRTGEYAEAPDRRNTGYLRIDDSKPVYSNLIYLLDNAAEVVNFIFLDENYEVVEVIRGKEKVMPPEGAKFLGQNLVSPYFSSDFDKLVIYQDLESDRLQTIEEALKGYDIKNEEINKAIKVIDFDNEEQTDSEIIKEAFDFADFGEERILIFNGRDWHIDEAILLPSNTTVIVDGVTIKQNDEVFDNIFRGDNLEIDPNNPYGTPLNVSEITNIKILGINGATLEGPDVNIKMEHPVLGLQAALGDFYGWRTLHISLSRASNFEVAGFKFRKTRCWGISMDKCHDYKVHDLDFNSNVKNGDGVNNRAGCYNFEVYNITGSTSDDSVAMTALGHEASSANYPRGNYLYPMEPTRAETFQFTKEEMSIRNGEVYNIHTTGNHHGVICLAATGLKVYDMNIHNIKETEPSTRESVVKIYSGYGGGYSANDLHNIRVNDVLSKGAQHAVQITHKVDNVWINKVRQERAGGNITTIANMDGVKVTNS